MTCLLIDPPAEGAWNMAADEALLASAASGEGCFLRFYRWSRPTLSLGYFQSYEARDQHPASRSCAVVRRISGGGAILHDAELTYCLVVPAAHRLAAGRLGLYRAVHEALVETLGDFGVEAEMCRGAEDGEGSSRFLCFQRRTPGDVLFRGGKIAGSAQRRWEGAVLQHGSVLLGRSVAAPELPSLEDLADRPIGWEALLDRWLPRLEAALGMGFRPSTLSPGQLEAARTLRDAKYASARWTMHRDRAIPGGAFTA